MPAMPLAIIGVGASPDALERHRHRHRHRARHGRGEKPVRSRGRSLRARPARTKTSSALKVSLDEGHDKNWTEVQSQTVDLSSLHAAVDVSCAGQRHRRATLSRAPAAVARRTDLREQHAHGQRAGAAARAACALFHAGTRRRLQISAHRTGRGSRRRLHRDVPRAGGPVHRAGRPHRLSGFGAGFPDEGRRAQALRLRHPRLVRGEPVHRRADANARPLRRERRRADLARRRLVVRPRRLCGQQARAAHAVDHQRRRARSRHRHVSRHRLGLRRGGRFHRRPARGPRRVRRRGARQPEPARRPASRRDRAARRHDLRSHRAGRGVAALRQGPGARHRHATRCGNGPRRATKRAPLRSLLAPGRCAG